MSLASELLFRRQYLLGPAFIDQLSSWSRIAIEGVGYLTFHPDLRVTQVSSCEKSLTLLGYILDPNQPHHSDQEILERLLENLNSADELVNALERLAGRYAIVLRLKNHRRILTDPAGFRQVFYHRNRSGSILCGSQPGIFAHCGELQEDPEFAEFSRSRYFRSDAEYWFPGTGSPYKDVRHLLPNTYLDLDNGSAVRYWPNANLPSITVDECVEATAPILKGTIAAAAHRFKLALAITAGLDSRILFAASNDNQNSIFYYTQSSGTQQNNRGDILVPRQLLAMLGLEHHSVVCPENIDPGFLGIYEKNFPFAHLSKGAKIFSSYELFNPTGFVVVNGVGNEITRCFYHSCSLENMDGSALAKAAGMDNEAYAINRFQEWLESIAPNRFNFDLRDLFYWEQRMGNWAAMVFAEADIAHETLSPYNCRYLLTNFLSVDVKHRQGPSYTLYRQLIKRLWPEALLVPINPPRTLGGKVKKAIVGALSAAGVYPYIKSLKDSL